MRPQLACLSQAPECRHDAARRRNEPALGKAEMNRGFPQKRNGDGQEKAEKDAPVEDASLLG
jgi:hypothetical protein